MITDGTTFISPLGLWFTVAMGALMLLLPRRLALVPIVVITCYMTLGQRVLVAGLDFTMIRIMIVFGWIRLIVRGEISAIRLGAIAKVVIWWVVSSILTYTLLWQTSEALINRLGLAFNALGLYFLFQLLIRDSKDIERALKLLAILIVPLAIAMLIEKTTGTNAFAAFGGVSETTVVRDGRLRCQGPFTHPILAGTFGATLAPLFVGLLWSRRFIGAIGIISATIITLTSSSSGPVMAYLFGMLCLAMWPLQRHMRAIRWGLLFTVIALHLVMKVPVWFLIARVGAFAASTGWHRAFLIDRAIAHLDEWWLIGTKSTAQWGGNLFDVTNQYILEGVDGGLPTMILFIAIIALSFRNLGRALAVIKDELIHERLLLWAMGASLFAHVTSFLSVSYFDQIVVIWYLLLAIISIATRTLSLQYSSAQATSAQLQTAAKSRSQSTFAGHRPPSYPYFSSPQKYRRDGPPY
ncbi:MAG TPA: hypothetical protein VGK99_22780 [Acidobacteriota bacterium]|jgi:hypothetical protein